MGSNLASIEDMNMQDIMPELDLNTVDRDEFLCYYIGENNFDLEVGKEISFVLIEKKIGNTRYYLLNVYGFCMIEDDEPDEVNAQEVQIQSQKSIKAVMHNFYNDKTGTAELSEDLTIINDSNNIYYKELKLQQMSGSTSISFLSIKEIKALVSSKKVLKIVLFFLFILVSFT